MTKLLKGTPLIDMMCEELIEKVQVLATHSIKPCLAIVRVGEKPNDISYEKTIIKRCDKIGITAKQVILPEDIPADEFYGNIEALNFDKSINAILLFRPLPEHIDGEKARNLIAAEKDVDGCTDLSLAGVFTGKDIGYPPCTAEAAIRILDFYDIDCSGKKVVVLGRSLVIGRPVAMMLLSKNASVTICHSRSENIAEIASSADILIACTGQAESIGAGFTNAEQCIIDVGVSYNAKKQKLCGDVDFDEVADKVAAITPVPGGVGGVTSTVLVKNVIEAAIKQNSFQ